MGELQKSLLFKKTRCTKTETIWGKQNSYKEQILDNG